MDNTSTGFHVYYLVVYQTLVLGMLIPSKSTQSDDYQIRLVMLSTETFAVANLCERGTLMRL
jgi:hypothetical protein